MSSLNFSLFFFTRTESDAYLCLCNFLFFLVALNTLRFQLPPCPKKKKGSRQRENHRKQGISHQPLLVSTSEKMSGKTTPQGHAVAVTTQEASDGSRGKAMRVSNTEHNSWNWVSISSAGALDMTNCDFSERPARDEMRHIIGSSEPDDIIGSDKDRNRRCKKKDKDHIEFLCELYEAQAAQGRYFLHELTSEASSRMKCMGKIMAMPGTRAAAADLCILGLAACDDGGPGFVNASVRTITNARQVGVRLQSNALARICMPGSMPKTQSEGRSKREHGCAEPPEQ